MHNSYSLSFPLTNDYKFQPTDRHYSSALPDNEFVEGRNGLASGSMNQPMTIGRQSSGIEYNGGQMQHETP